MRLRIHLLMLLSLFLVRAEPNAQPLSPEEWEKITRDLDYTEEKEEIEYSTEGWEQDHSSSAFSEFLNQFLTVLPYIVLTLLAGFIVYFIISKYRGPEKKLEKIKSEISTAEENIEEADLIKLLQKANKTGDYRLILRIYYLMILKSLTLEKHIRYAPKKTNRDYLYEIKNSEIKSGFSSITIDFDRLWYGKSRLNEAEFEKQKSRSIELLSHLKNNPE